MKPLPLVFPRLVIGFFFFFLVLVLETAVEVSACTAILVGRKASTDGSVFVTHSDDGEGIADPRIMHVPSRAIIDGGEREILPDLEDFPRYVGYHRGPDYYPEKITTTDHDYDLTEPIGYIDVVHHMRDVLNMTVPAEAKTYSYFDGTTGIQNSQQLIVGGESTCSGIFSSIAIGKPNGKALLSINELTRIALEYTTKARDAIALMGTLAAAHGFYGADQGFEGSAESVLVADPLEGWVFHILPDDTGTSAIWVAQRVPDHHVTIVANMFTIRGVNASDANNFMGNFDYMLEVAKRNQLLPQDQQSSADYLLDFTKTFSNGEYGHKYYSGRRMWGAYRLIAPSLNLNPNYDNLQLQDNIYPWSVEPDQPLSLQDVFGIHRDYYQGTPYDLSKGLAAGPFGNPDRFVVPYQQRQEIQKKYYDNNNNNNNDEQQTTGPGWERPIALFRTTYTTVSQARSWIDNDSMIGGVMWLGSYAPHGTCFLPFGVGIDSLPQSITTGKMTGFVDAANSWRSTAFWTFRYIHSLTRLRYSLLSKIIQKAQHYWENDIAINQLQQYIEQQSQNQPMNSSQLTQLYHNHTASVLEAWWKLADQLVLLYADGFDNSLQDADTNAPPLGYPMEWLEGVGYQYGPPPPPQPAKPSTNDDNNNSGTDHTIRLLYHTINIIVILFLVAVVVCECCGDGGSTFNIPLFITSRGPQQQQELNKSKDHYRHNTPDTVWSSSSFYDDQSLDDDLDGSSDDGFLPLQKKYGSMW